MTDESSPCLKLGSTWSDELGSQARIKTGTGAGDLPSSQSFFTFMDAVKQGLRDLVKSDNHDVDRQRHGGLPSPCEELAQENPFARIVGEYSEVNSHGVHYGGRREAKGGALFAARRFPLAYIVKRGFDTYRTCQ